MVNLKDINYKTMTEEQLKPFYNEYMRRYRYKKRSSWNAIRRDCYKKNKNHSNIITKDKKSDDNIINKINIFN